MMINITRSSCQARQNYIIWTDEDGCSWKSSPGPCPVYSSCVRGYMAWADEGGCYGKPSLAPYPVYSSCPGLSGWLQAAIRYPVPWIVLSSEADGCRRSSLQLALIITRLPGPLKQTAVCGPNSRWRS